MFKPSTVTVARPLAETLTANGLLLRPKSPNFPVAVMADHFRAPLQAEHRELSGERTDQVVENFRHLNAKVTDLAADEFDQLVELMSFGLERMLTTVREAVIPTCKAIRSGYDSRSEVSRLAQIEVKPLVLHKIHDEPGLTSHIADRYLSVPQAEAYRSFLIATPSVETLVQWLSANRHVDAALTADWACGVGADTLRLVWSRLFGTARSLTAQQLSFRDLGGFPFNVDAVLTAYLLTHYLLENPQDVTGEGVSLDEWEHAILLQHQYFGAQLAQGYVKRAQARTRQRVVWRYEAEQPMTDGRVVVVVNQDVYPDWLSRGGDVKALLGAAIADPARTHAADLTAVQADLIAVWERKHYLIRQSRLDNYLRQRRSHLRTLLLVPPQDVRELLPKDISAPELEGRVAKLLQSVQEEDLHDINRVISKLVCEVYYPNTPYRSFLDAMDRIAADQGDLPPREVATIAAVEMIAAWLAQQVSSLPFEALLYDRPVSPDIAPQPIDEAPASADADDIREVNDEAAPATGA
jgi:hypothetical protein